MNSKYKILNYKSQNTSEIEDLISIEEPLEISIEFKQNDTFNKRGSETFYQSLFTPDLVNIVEFIFKIRYR